MNFKKFQMQHELRMAGFHFQEVKQHLFPGDGLEAMAIALCGRFKNERATKLLVHKVVLIPHSECVRKADFIEWPTDRIALLLEEASKKNLALIKIHCHPGWYDSFSGIDDVSDKEFFDSVFGWTLGTEPNGSVVMLPDGSMFGRVIMPDLSFKKMDRITVIGDEIVEWPKPSLSGVEEVGRRTSQLFGEGTYQRLKQLRIGVLGCSGTGTPVLEQLHRYTVGHIIIVDSDHVEYKNLNRILYSKKRDVKDKAKKVVMLKKAIDEIGLGSKIEVYPVNIYDSPDAVRRLADCDLIIGCSDTAEGRDLLNKVSTFYLVPYVDMGIAIESDGKGGINKIEGSVHFIQPGKSSLLTRGAYSLDDVVAEGLYRKNRVEYDRLVAESRRTGFKYIKDVDVDRPAVISVNMQIAAIAVNELLNRIHPYKIELPEKTAKIAVDITDNFMTADAESDFNVDSYLLKRVGRGDMIPLLEVVDLSEVEA
jgi:molybdopterin/thiamine biosynthesis adenylyltransferase